MAPNPKAQLCFIDGSFEELATELATYLNIPSQEVAPLLEENKKDDVRMRRHSPLDLPAFLLSRSATQIQFAQILTFFAAGPTKTRWRLYRTQLDSRKRFYCSVQPLNIPGQPIPKDQQLPSAHMRKPLETNHKFATPWSRACSQRPDYYFQPPCPRQCREK